MKILVVVPSLRNGVGTASHVISYYRNLYKHIDVDFALYIKTDNDNTKEIAKNGGKIFYFKKSLFGSRAKIEEFFEKEASKYNIIHCHTFNYGLPYLFYAKKYGIKRRIIHIHSVNYSENTIKRVINRLFIMACKRVANVYVACSKQAGKKAFGTKKFHIINNGIDIHNFSIQNRSSVRRELDIADDNFLFGNVGRLVKTKNQSFLIDVFGELKKKSKFKDSKLLIIGSGPEYQRLLKLIKEKKLEGDVVFISGISNMADYYAAMDCFIFPSLHEGLGMVLVEAQASGLPCFCSDTLPEEVMATDLVKGLDLELGSAEWGEIISNESLSRKDVKEQLINAGFDIKTESKKLIQFYKDICNGHDK